MSGIRCHYQRPLLGGSSQCVVLGVPVRCFVPPSPHGVVTPLVRGVWAPYPRVRFVLRARRGAACDGHPGPVGWGVGCGLRGSVDVDSSFVQLSLPFIPEPHHHRDQAS